MKTSLPVILLTIILMGCESKSSQSEAFTLQISDAKKNSFVSQIDSLSFIRLETTDSSIIGSVQQLSIVNNNVYVVDGKWRRVLIFNNRGKYLYSINKTGNAPGEYTRITDLFVEKSNGHLFILDSEVHKIIEYDNEGKFINQRKLPFNDPISSFYKLDTATIVFYKSFIRKDNENSILVCSNDFKNRKELSPHAKTTSLLLSARVSLYTGNEGLCYLPLYSQKLYQIHKDNITEKYSFDFGKNNIDSEIYKQHYSNPTAIFDKLNAGNSIYFLTILESGNTIYADFFYKGIPYFFCYNKDTKKSGLFYDEKMSDVGDSFFPLTTTNGKFAAIVSPAYLKEFSPDVIEANHLNQIGPESNPVILLYQFKN